MSCDRDLSHHEFANDTSGKPLRICLDCHGHGGSKVCGVCKVRQDVKFFRKVRRTDGSTYPERACLECRKIRKRENRLLKKPRSTSKPRIFRGGAQAPGWTPPPTLQELAVWHLDLRAKSQINKLGWGIQSVHVPLGE